MNRLTTFAALIAGSIALAACTYAPQAQHHRGDGGYGGAALTVYFGFDSSELTAEAKDDIAVLASNVSGMSGVMLEIIGHTDTSGDAAYNNALSLRRANAVHDELVAQGVDDSAADVSVSGRGESDPAVDTGDGVREAANRRVGIYLRGHGGYGGKMHSSGVCPTIIGADAHCAWPHNNI